MSGWGQTPTDSSTTHNFLVKVEKFQSTTDTTEVDLEYIEVPNEISLQKLSTSLTQRNYPLIIVQKNQFAPGVRVVKEMQLLLLNHELKEKEWMAIDSIHQAKEKVFNEIIAMEKERVEVYKGANQDLTDRIHLLSEQLTLSTELTEKTLKGRGKKECRHGPDWGSCGNIVGSNIGSNSGKLRNRISPTVHLNKTSCHLNQERIIPTDSKYDVVTFEIRVDQKNARSRGAGSERYHACSHQPDTMGSNIDL